MLNRECEESAWNAATGIETFDPKTGTVYQTCLDFNSKYFSENCCNLIAEEYDSCDVCQIGVKADKKYVTKRVCTLVSLRLLIDTSLCVGTCFLVHFLASRLHVDLLKGLEILLTLLATLAIVTTHGTVRMARAVVLIPSHANRSALLKSLSSRKIRT
jgi:hypothetical protein